MPGSRFVSHLLLACSFLLPALQVAAQTVIATIPVGSAPVALAINTVTNQIFAVNQNSNNLTIINGGNNGTAVVPVGNFPVAAALNPSTNKIYVANRADNTVTIVDGTTLATVTVPAGISPQAIAVNAITNRVYVVNQNSNNVTVIDGFANSLIATVPVGLHPRAVAINSASNKIYVANVSDGSVTVIDGASNSPTRIYTGGGYPYAVAVNSMTNRIYVANLGGTVSVIDGGPNNSLLASVTVGGYPCALAVNPVSNMIYVSNYYDATVSVIDGAQNTATATVTVGQTPGSTVVDPMTNVIYVGNYGDGTVSAFNGTDRFVTTVWVRWSPDAVALNPLTNRIYVANRADDTVSVIAGASSDPLQFVPVTPCRVADTRKPTGPFGGPPIGGGASRDFIIPNSACGIPSTAASYSLNITVVPGGPLSYLAVWPTGQDQPTVSTLNSDGRVKANAAIVPAGASGAIRLFVTNTTNVIIDINGYFAPVEDSTLAFYPLYPCRAVDTRGPNGPFAGPSLRGGAAGREFPMRSSSCHIPAAATAYSLNFTAVPKGPLGYLTTWPAGQNQPLVSTLNALTGVPTANAAIVPAGNGGDIDVFVSNDSDVLIDINGYFAPPAAGGLSLYNTAPCRVLDTRLSGGLFVGTIPVSVVTSPCGLSYAAQAFVLNATVVPQPWLGYLTLWDAGAAQPLVSTLNAFDGAITSNMAIVSSSNGWIGAYASNPTQLLLDSSGYFGP
jgi:YVTN family beta-propeller protein